MEWVTSTLHTTSKHGVSSITTADAHTSAVSSRLNRRPRRIKWTRPFRRKTKYGFCACAITFQKQSTRMRIPSTNGSLYHCLVVRARDMACQLVLRQGRHGEWLANESSLTACCLSGCTRSPMCLLCRNWATQQDATFSGLTAPSDSGSYPRLRLQYYQHSKNGLKLLTA
jgi:hypothetical protein